MGRDAKIQHAVLKSLTTNELFEFSELLSAVESAIKKKVDGAALSHALTALMQRGSIRKVLVDGKIKYGLTKKFKKQKLKDFLIENLQKFDVEQFYPYSDSGEIPRLLFSSEISDPFTIIDRGRTPSGMISIQLVNDYQSLPREKQEVMANFIAWSIWVGVQEKKKVLVTSIEDCLAHSQQKLDEAKGKGDIDREKIESSIIEILNLSKTLIEKDSLEDFLDFLYQNQTKARTLLETATKKRGLIGGGELFFEQLSNLQAHVFSGLSVSGFENFVKTIHENGVDDKEVWSNFIKFIMNSNLEVLGSVRGDLFEAITMVKRNGEGAKELLSLLIKNKFIIVYLWGYPEVVKLIDIGEVVESFDGWYDALRRGYLDHRSWLFREEIFELIRSAYRRVRSGRSPEPIRIDQEPWTLEDLYRQHPRGKDPEFWMELIGSLKARAKNGDVDGRQK